MTEPEKPLEEATAEPIQEGDAAEVGEPETRNIVVGNTYSVEFDFTSGSVASDEHR